MCVLLLSHSFAGRLRFSLGRSHSGVSIACSFSLFSSLSASEILVSKRGGRKDRIVAEVQRAERAEFAGLQLLARFWSVFL